MTAGQRMMMIAGAIDTQNQYVSTPNKTLALKLHLQQSPQETFEQALQVLASEKYKVQIADKSKGLIKVVRTSRGGGAIYSAAYLYIHTEGSGNTPVLEAMFARYPGFIGGGSPQKWAASFEKDMLAVQPGLTTEK